MQKAKSKSAVRRASGNSGKAGSTGKAGKAKKQLTPEQRERKRRADRARRRRIKLAKQATQARQGHSCGSRGCSCGSVGCTCGRDDRTGETGNSPRRRQASSPVTALDVAVVIGAHVARQVADAMPGRDVVSMSKLEDVEPGVSRGKVAFSDGSKAVVTLVDGDAVDPLSRFSPLPPQVKNILLRARIAREVSDLVDAHANCLVGDCE